MGGEWSASRPGRSLSPGKGPPVPIVQEAGWAPAPVWTQRLEEKSFAPAGDRTPIDRSNHVLQHFHEELLCSSSLPNEFECIKIILTEQKSCALEEFVKNLDNKTLIMTIMNAVTFNLKQFVIFFVIPLRKLQLIRTFARDS